MSTLVDTDILIDYLREQPSAVSLVDRTASAEGGLLGSLVSKAELLAGMREAQSRETFELISTIAWMPVTDEIAERAGGLAREYPRAGMRFAIADYLIAATTQMLGAALLTRNVRHFPMFPDLEAPYVT